MARLSEKRRLDGLLSLVPAELPEPGEAAAADTATPLTFERAYAMHAGYVAGLAGRILGRNDDVPDVVQEVFLIAHRRLSNVRQASALRTWLGRITVREASRRLRWRRLRNFLTPANVEVDLIADETAAELRPLVALLYVALDRLPARERSAWVLRNLLDEPLDQVAELCSCSLATAKRRIAAADILLEPLLAPAGENKENA
jgi:RNA polymerase sigma-70 factor (ECF subfamily)